MGTKDDTKKPTETPAPKDVAQPKQTPEERAARMAPGPDQVKVAKGTVTL